MIKSKITKTIEESFGGWPLKIYLSKTFGEETIWIENRAGYLFTIPLDEYGKFLEFLNRARHLEYKEKK